MSHALFALACNLAVVTDNKSSTLFVLARDPKDFAATYEQSVLAFLKTNGFAPIATKHTDKCKPYIAEPSPASITATAKKPTAESIATQTIPGLVSSAAKAATTTTTTTPATAPATTTTTTTKPAAPVPIVPTTPKAPVAKATVPTTATTAKVTAIKPATPAKAPTNKAGNAKKRLRGM